MAPLPGEHFTRERDARRLSKAKASHVSGTDGDPIGPTLSELTGVKAADWPKPVRDWFDAWRRSPQARLFVSEVEWRALARWAYLLQMVHDPDTSHQSRIQSWNSLARLESSLGATHVDRIKSHMKIKPAETEAPKPPATVDYRAMLA